jgi:hypothetical protein
LDLIVVVKSLFCEATALEFGLAFFNSVLLDEKRNHHPTTCSPDGDLSLSNPFLERDDLSELMINELI